MNAHVSPTSAINWNSVFRFVFRFAWALVVLAFKLALIAFSFIIKLLTAGGNEGSRDTTHYHEGDEEPIYKFGSESKYNLYKNDTRF